MKEPSMPKAMTTREFLRRDEETRRLYEERQRALHDYAWAMEDSKDGREEGWREGLQEVQQQVARKMLDKGVSLEDIADITELSIEQIQKIRDRND
ncbi:MAG: hypothetical protein A2201_08815 [Alicyclobacillus sp. RIFOXYA1_FULL_53_8]|nr:MAG: hypothetical protein A2201_08815 [Alicyclobacillus sp. RIFOXYA1_FULL_53_8]